MAQAKDRDKRTETSDKGKTEAKQPESQTDDVKTAQAGTAGIKAVVPTEYDPAELLARALTNATETELRESIKNQERAVVACASIDQLEAELERRGLNPEG